MFWLQEKIFNSKCWSVLHPWVALCFVSQQGAKPSPQEDKVWSSFNLFVWPLVQILQSPKGLNLFLLLESSPIALASLMWNKRADLPRREDIYDASSSLGYWAHTLVQSPATVVSGCSLRTRRSWWWLSEDHQQRSTPCQDSFHSQWIGFICSSVQTLIRYVFVLWELPLPNKIGKLETCSCDFFFNMDY